jgi:hypothetical protein
MIKYILIAHCRGGLCPYYHRYLECCIHDGTSPAVAVPKTGMPDWCPLNDIEDIKTIAQGRREAAEAARLWYRSDCGGCGEFCEGHPETENDYSRKCSHLAGLRKAILGTASDEKADKGEI